MGKAKAGFLTPKAIANRIKAKGLQKLRWYCQMCQKQCRDENGFKCHLTSESHQRQLLLFADNPDTYLDAFSDEFVSTFLELLRRRFGTKRVQANQVYQEYISDRDHTHMNSTQWETLTDFVKWLGREGKCVVDQTEKGWFMAYIDRDPETIRRQEQANTKAKMELDDEERTSRFIQQQIERAEAGQSEKAGPAFSELQRTSEEEKVTFSLGGGAEKSKEAKTIKPSVDLLKADSSKNETAETSAKHKGMRSTGALKRKSALDEIMEVEEKKREKLNRKENWICKDIVVKIITKKLGEKYYKKKAIITDVIDQFGAVVKLLTGEHKVKLDQAHLETVIPAEGKTVKIVNGGYRGLNATLMSLNTDKFTCTLKINQGPLKGRVVDDVAYEDMSKLYQPT